MKMKTFKGVDRWEKANLWITSAQVGGAPVEVFGIGTWSAVLEKDRILYHLYEV